MLLINGMLPFMAMIWGEQADKQNYFQRGGKLVQLIILLKCAWQYLSSRQHRKITTSRMKPEKH